MRFVPWQFAILLWPAAALAFDFGDYDAVCLKTAETVPTYDPDAFHQICTCAYDVIEQELGTDLTVIYARFELADATLEEMLPSGTSTDAFFEQLGSLGPKIDATCTR